MPTVLQLIKNYKGNAPLLNSMISQRGTEFRTIVCYLTGIPDGCNEMDQIADHTIYCRLPARKVNWNRLRTLRQVAAVIDQYQVDLVVCQFRRPIPIGVLAARLSRRKPKVIGVLHGIVGGRVGVLRKLINLVTYRGLASLVSVSNTGVDDIVRHNIGLDRRKIVAIANGISCESFLEPANSNRRQLFGSFGDDVFLFAMVGRLAPVKNHVRVLRAFAKLAAHRQAVRLVIVGAGALDNQIKTIAAELGVEPYISLTGRRHDVPEILKHVDCFLMPSLREGMPLALMEAMVSGCAVITSRVKGMYELVPDERYGFLVDPESIDSIYQAMARMVDLPAEERSQLGHEARQRILNHFTAGMMLANYESLYRRVLAGN